MTRELTVCLLFDTTGSMTRYLATVRRRVRRIGKLLKGFHPNVRLGIVAYGDHCDGDMMLQEFEPSASLRAFESFVKGVKGTSGGDWPEALECALERLTHWDWGDEDSARVVVLLADAPSHTAEECPAGNDWKDLVRTLAGQGVIIHPCLCGKDMRARKQMKTVAKMSGGCFLSLAKAEAVVDLIVAAAAREVGQLDTFVADLARKGRLDDERRAFLVELSPRACFHS